jgi:hypothetical protein
LPNGLFLAKTISMKYFIFPFILVLFLQSCNQGVPGTQEQSLTDIYQLMDLQEQAWNAGDIKTFMLPYELSDSLLFVNKRGLRYGFEANLQAYLDGYPDREQMGTLTFENLNSRFLCDTHVMVVGKWHLARTAGDIEGYYTLIWAFKNGKWFIIADHTS